MVVGPEEEAPTRVLGPFSPLVLIPHHTFVLVADTLVADALILTAAYNEHTLHLNRLVLSSPFFIILIVIRNVYTIFILQ